jgi:hypothetical protein
VREKAFFSVEEEITDSHARRGAGVRYGVVI